ncbi:NAD+ kinase [Oscillospiraceae bacterium]|nr:NAD+ kinase [Oscillospiraceae bacterium]
MRFGIHSNKTRDLGYEVAQELASVMLSHGHVPVFREYMQDTALGRMGGVEFGGFADCDIIFTIGGDGTFLGVISDYRELGVPFVGVNKGSIGFLTQISEDSMEDAITRITEGRYNIIERMQLSAELYDSQGNLKGHDVCLNDVAVLRGDKPHIVKLSLYIDHERVERFYGDGLVVATPTGSTAYTLAAGGPLLMPGMDNIIITPLCPHTLQSTSYVIGPDSEVEIRLGNFETIPIVTPDGHEFPTLSPYDVIRIRKHPSKVKTVDLGYTGFFQNVRRKIVARGSFYENSQE